MNGSGRTMSCSKRPQGAREADHDDGGCAARVAIGAGPEQELRPRRGIRRAAHSFAARDGADSGQHALLAGLDLEGQILGVNATLGKTAGDEPEAGLRGAREHVAQLLPIAKTPDGAEAGGDVVAEQLANQVFLALIAGRQHDQVGGKRGAATHACSLGDELGDVGPLGQGYGAIDDQIGAADVEIVSAAAGEVFELPARAVLAEVELEALAFQAVEEVAVQVPGLLGEADVAFFGEGQRHGGRDQVAVLQGRCFVIQRVGKLRARLDVDDQGRTSLHQRDSCAARVQVLRDVVAAVASADDKGALALPCLAIVVLAGVQDLAAEARQRRDVRQARNAADAGGHDHVSRMHLAWCRPPDGAPRTSAARVRHRRRPRTRCRSRS